MELDTHDLQFMDNLFAGLDASHFSLDPSQSPPKTRTLPAPSISRHSPRQSKVAAPISPNKSPLRNVVKLERGPDSSRDLLIDDLLDWSPLLAAVPPHVKRRDQVSHETVKRHKTVHQLPRSPIEAQRQQEEHNHVMSASQLAHRQRQPQKHRAFTRCQVLAVIERTYAPTSASTSRVLSEKVLVLELQPRFQTAERAKQPYPTKSSQVKNSRETFLAFLRDEWYHTDVTIGDIVHLVGSFEPQNFAVPEQCSPSKVSNASANAAPKVEVQLEGAEKTERVDHDDDLWDDMSSLPAFSQLGTQEMLASEPPPQTLARTMIFASRSSPSSSISDNDLAESHSADPRDNLLIVHPDVLVPATKVADVASCPRKPIIQDRLRGASDMTPSLVMGNMLHEVLQACLSGHDQSSSVSDSELALLSVKAEHVNFESPWPEDWSGIGDFSKSFVERQIRAQVQANIESLYAIGMDIQEAMSNLREKASPFARFANTFLARHNQDFHPEATICDSRMSNTATGTTPARIRLTRILDVEEEIWSPMFGLKGKVDVSVECDILEPSSIKADPKPGAFSRGGNTAQEERSPQISKSVLPLELKTGRAEVVSTEHRAQTMLYTLMMSDRYGSLIAEGLLYYSKSGELHRISRSRNEVRSLIIGRNELAHYMRHDTKQQHNSALASHAVQGLLPPTIDNEHKCRKCYAVDGCMLFRRTIENVTEPPPDTKDAKHQPLVADIEGQFSAPTVPKRSSIADLFEQKTAHLSQAHVEFFRKWERLLTLEEEDTVRFRREMWTMKAEDRERVGRCFANMRLERKNEDDDSLRFSGRGMGKVTRCFRRHLSPPSQGGAESLLSGHISINDPVSISIEPSMLSVAQGFVTKLTPTRIEVAMDHDLHHALQRALEERGVPPSAEALHDIVFRIDKDELASGMGRLRANLANLFLSSERGGDVERRELVVDLRPPQFLTAQEIKEAYPSAGIGANIVDEVEADEDLNEDQKQAMLKVLAARDYALILGMPGTGKTTTIAKLIKILTRMGKRVLLTSYTHSAVDTILRKLATDSNESPMRILRLGNRDKVHPDAHSYLLPQCSTLEELQDALEGPNVVASTCLNIHHTLFSAGMAKLRKGDVGGGPSKSLFDYCIVDEASQIPLPTCLGPLRFADKFVLVGDHHQLPPLVKNSKARMGGLDVSLFKMLSDHYEAQAMVYLKSQYRMNEDIMHLSNTLVYKGALKAGSDAVRRRMLELPHTQRVLASASSPTRPALRCLRNDWLKDSLEPESKVRFLDTSALPLHLAAETKQGELVKNVFEAELVVGLVSALVQAGCSSDNIAVITPYRQQIKLLRSLLHAKEEVCHSQSQEGKEFEGIELLTADQSQGRDKDVIIVTFTRASATAAAEGSTGPATSGSGTGELLNDLRRLNVTLTRAKKKLLLIGHAQTLKGSETLRPLLALLSAKGWMRSLTELPSQETVPQPVVEEEEGPRSRTVSSASSLFRAMSPSPPPSPAPASAPAPLAGRAPPVSPTSSPAAVTPLKRSNSKSSTSRSASLKRTISSSSLSPKSPSASKFKGKSQAKDVKPSTQKSLLSFFNPPKPEPSSCSPLKDVGNTET